MSKTTPKEEHLSLLVNSEGYSTGFSPSLGFKNPFSDIQKEQNHEIVELPLIQRGGQETSEENEAKPEFSDPSLKNSASFGHVKEYIVSNYTERDQSSIIGFFPVFLYVGVWIGSCVLCMSTVFFLLMGFYKICIMITASIISCYIIPWRPIQRLRRLARISMGRYFKAMSILFEHIPDQAVDRPTILCISPHGVFSFCWAHCYLTDELHHFRWCFSTLLNFSPFLRVLVRLLGHPSNVRKKTVIDHMKNGRSLALIPGGWHEASIHNHLRDRIYIKQRQGFVKYALHYGYTITPAYAFGERMTYRNLQGCYRLRFWLNGLGITTIIPWGRKWCPLFPKPVALHTVIGKPIQLPHKPDPTPFDVEQAHQMYMDTMQQLFEKYKHRFYGPAADRYSLELW